MDLTLSTTILLIILGFTPSIVWLALFLREDLHPEPNYLIIRTFLFGIIIAPLIVLLEWLASHGVKMLHIGDIARYPAVFLFTTSFIEEYGKYLITKVTVFHRQDFDEPTDAMIYLITTALGFAAIENIVVLFQSISAGLEITLTTWGLRFLGATILHALASAIIGYFVGLIWFSPTHHKKRLLATGIMLATSLHFLFNLSVLAQRETTIFTPHTLLLSTALVLVLLMFRQLHYFRSTEPTATIT